MNNQGVAKKIHLRINIHTFSIDVVKRNCFEFGFDFISDIN